MGNEAVEVGGKERLIRRQRILAFEIVDVALVRDLAAAPVDLLSVEAVQLCQLLLLRRHREIVRHGFAVGRIFGPRQENREEAILASKRLAPKLMKLITELVAGGLHDDLGIGQIRHGFHQRGELLLEVHPEGRLRGMQSLRCRGTTGAVFSRDRDQIAAVDVAKLQLFRVTRARDRPHVVGHQVMHALDEAE
ncbi:hypothetical protein [Bradyrhizobium zhanjiangense]|uniref:Uncharacterized protein n=1 Tax=Bradyrhizobium zhanjiangense TaxID=1325107 RepID=A0A4Q0Q8X2_9BRAD|nr:hypothetical protein [Bradyrhizobium zhanjiangense]RXG85340.1 hypothetical protein EAS61_36430 [Bradyrhizobium zhanjiangense]